MPAIETNQLTRHFGSGTAVDHLTLTAEAGEVLALLGPNGAGKTTTVRLLNGVLNPHDGSARVLGLDPVTHGDDLRARTGVLTEHAGLDDRLTARENLTFTARIRGLHGPTAARRIDELLGQFGMIERADDLVQGFSTGQRKRLGLARALIHDPEVLFLDEPTSGLDPTATREVIELISSLAVEHGRTVVLCTHFLAEAGRLAHKMAVLSRGKLQAFGRPSELAAELWPYLEASVDLGGPADPATLDAIAKLDGVAGAERSDDGTEVRVTNRDVLPHVVALLVQRGATVYSAVPRPPTLEDVYFEIEARAEGARAQDLRS